MSRQHNFAAVIIGKSGLIREGLSRILSTEKSRTLASVSAIDELPPSKLHTSPLLFLIIHTDDDCDITIDQIEFLKERNPTARIAIVADRYRLDRQLFAFRAGVHGYFVNVKSCAVFVKSIELIMMGETLFPPAFLSHALDTAHDDVVLATARESENNEGAILFRADETMVPHLSMRERSILHFLIEGASNKTIARKMDIAEATVKVHVKAILRKIRVQNRTQAAIWGVNHRPQAGLAAISSLTPAVDAGAHLVPFAEQLEVSSR